MNEDRQIVDELAHRIDADARRHGGTLPERVAIAWRGYLAATLEWNLIAVTDYESLLGRLPAIADDPTIGILTGID